MVQGKKDWLALLSNERGICDGTGALTLRGGCLYTCASDRLSPATV